MTDKDTLINVRNQNHEKLLTELESLMVTGLENSTRPLVFTSVSGCRASEYFDISTEN